MDLSGSLADVAGPMPLSKAKIHRLGNELRENGPSDSLRERFGVLSEWYDKATLHLETLVESELSRAFPGLAAKVTSRAKRLETAHAKLCRQPTYPLENIADLGGLRVSGWFSLADQERITSWIAESLAQNPDSIIDHRQGDNAGYRAMHVRAKLKPSNARFEIQIRTAAQNAWANLYEDLGELVGRGIRYGETEGVLPGGLELAEKLRSMSLDLIARQEDHLVRVAGIRSSNAEMLERMRGSAHPLLLFHRGRVWRHQMRAVRLARSVDRSHQRLVDTLERLRMEMTKVDRTAGRGGS